jgi:hypothetical protein
MSISAINSLSTPAIASTAPASAITAASDPTAPGSTAAPAATQLSSFGQFMSNMQSLEQSNPTKASQILGSIASKLSAQAQTVGGSRGAQLSQLATKFQAAAQTGDLSSIQPQQTSNAASGSHHHGGSHHHRGASSYSQSQASADNQSVLDTMSEALESATGIASN